MFANPTTPNQADYLLFLRNTVNIKATLLPDDSPAIATSLSVAMECVNPDIACASAIMYVYAVYNLATDRLINYAQDQTGQTFFRDMRSKSKLNLEAPAVGVVAGSSDESTSTTLLNPEQMKYFTLRDLQMLKTPWGREYMGIAQSVGPIWGLS